MNTFARVSAALAIAASSSGAFAIELPPAGDCNQMAASQGAGGFWVGRFTGSYKDFFDVRRPLFAEGCFATEYECRRWINEVQSVAIDPGLMTCRPGGPQ